MASAEQLGSAFIDLSYKGFEAIKSGMGQIKSVAKDVGESFDKLASKSTTAFASMSGALLATTRSASPQLFNTFTGALGALSAVVGVKLMPVLMDFTRWIVDTGKWLASIDDATWKQIGSWLKWGIVITGAIVALSTLKGVFGGFLVSTLKFAAANPLLAAFIAVVGVVTLLLSKMDELNNKTLENIKNVDRLKGGNVNEDDMKKSWVGKDLQAIADPKERAKAAQAIIDKETKRMNDATNTITNKGAFGLGMSRIGQGLGFNTDTSELDKVQQDAGRNIGIATAIKNKAMEGKDLEIKKAPDKNTGNELFQQLSGLGMNQKAVQVGGVGDIWKSIQQSQVEDPQIKIMNMMFGGIEKTNAELAKLNGQIAVQNQGMEIPSVGGK